MSNTDAHFRLRLPVQLKNEIEEAAKQRGSSINAEIVRRLEGVTNESENLLNFLREEAAELEILVAGFGHQKEAASKRLDTVLKFLVNGKTVNQEIVNDLRRDLNSYQQRYDEYVRRLRRIKGVLGNAE